MLDTEGLSQRAVLSFADPAQRLNPADLEGRSKMAFILSVEC